MVFIIAFLLKTKIKSLPGQFQQSDNSARVAAVAVCVHIGDQMRLLVRAPLLICVFMFLTEREEAAVEVSEGNTTAGADVDKRVKRRLLMGKKCLSKIILLFVETF